MAVRINHIAVVVEDIEQALRVFGDAIGLPVDHIAAETEEQVRVAFLPTANGKIELIQPLTAESGVAKFLARRGEGLHHICLEVEDIKATVKEMKARGLEVLGEPRSNERGETYIFVHPKSAHGVLLELYEQPAQT